MVDIMVGQDEQVLFLFEIGWVYVDLYLVCIEEVGEYVFVNFIYSFIEIYCQTSSPWDFLEVFLQADCEYLFITWLIDKH